MPRSKQLTFHDVRMARRSAAAGTAPRARAVPGRALLDPAQSRASADRGAGEGGTRFGDEECRGTVCADREPGVREVGARARGRFHHHVLRKPREVRNALAYVLLNVRKHRVQRGGGAPPVRLDEASSGRWFEGWKRSPPATGTVGIRDVAPARSWLLATGWRRHGLIDPGGGAGGRVSLVRGMRPRATS